MKCRVFLAAITGGNARRTGSALLLFGLIQMVRLKAAAPARASLTAQGKWPPVFSPSQNNIFPFQLVCRRCLKHKQKVMLHLGIKKGSEWS